MYFLLVLLFVTNFVVAFILYDEYKQTRTLSQTLKANQSTDALAIKTYIACLLTIPPTTTPDQIPAKEQVCFDNAPPVR
jgi:hypothetical protein